jgi:hypothetical protein
VCIMYPIGRKDLKDIELLTTFFDMDGAEKGV